MSGREWLTTTELGRLYGVKGCTVKKWIHKGKFSSARKENGRGGIIWYVNINDKGIDPDVKRLWEKQIKTTFLRPSKEIHKEEIIDRLDNIESLLKEFLGRRKAK